MFEVQGSGDDRHAEDGTTEAAARGGELAVDLVAAIPRQWTFDLPFEKPLSTNEVYGKHWAVSRGLTQPWKAAVWVAVRNAKIPKLERFTFTLHYAPKKYARRDLDNLNATGKIISDGLVKANVCVDDNYKRYIPTTPVIHEPTGLKSRIWVVVEDLGAPDV